MPRYPSPSQRNLFTPKRCAKSTPCPDLISIWGKVSAFGREAGGIPRQVRGVISAGGYLVGSSTNCFPLAISRISSVIFIEQYFGPHMLQK